MLNNICNIFINISKKRTIIFPVHPRTRKNLEESGLLTKLKNTSNIILSEPLSYIKFMNLVFNCGFVITDSGGIQEETTYLGIPCLTMRPNTERPVTISQGTNTLCTIENLEKHVQNILNSIFLPCEIHASKSEVYSVKAKSHLTMANLTGVKAKNSILNNHVKLSISANRVS